MTIKDRIIFATLTGIFSADLRQRRVAKPEEFEISDLDIKNFLVNAPVSDLVKLRDGPYYWTFMKNAQAALDRITAVELARGNLRLPQYGRSAAGGPHDLFAEPAEKDGDAKPSNK